MDVSTDAMSRDKSFEVIIDRKARVITIQGIRYSFDIFDQVAFAPVGSRFEMGERRNDVRELRTIPTIRGQ